MEDTKNKIKQTNLKKYGVENPQQSEEIKEKTRQTNLKKYGVRYTLSNSTIRQKIKDTYMAKYGVDCNLKVSEVKDKIKQTNLDRYGNTLSFSFNTAWSNPDHLFQFLATKGWIFKYYYTEEADQFFGVHTHKNDDNCVGLPNGRRNLRKFKDDLEET